MRVIAGKAKGHRLKSLRSAHLRPTSDLVRGAIFSALESLATDWFRVLDLYAGTGALGIEALSRGAGWGDFVDQDPRCCTVIEENLERTKLTQQAHVCCSPVKRALSFLSGNFGLIFLDPPYSDPSTPLILERLASSSLVSKGTTIVIEHSRRLPLKAAYGHLCLVKNLDHGDTSVSIYQFTRGSLP